MITESTPRGVDTDYLFGVLRALDHAGRIALIDAVERWWHAQVAE